MLEDQSLLIVEDDDALRETLARAMAALGYDVTSAGNLADAAAEITQSPPAFAIIDLRLAEQSGLDVIEKLLQMRPEARAVVVSGYANFATAVSALRLGAVNYLTKPVTAEEIDYALKERNPKSRDLGDLNLPSAKQARMDHIVRFLKENDFNLSATARELGMHRRTLQRIIKRSGMKLEDVVDLETI